MKRVFGTVEMCFDGIYLAAAVIIGLILLLTGGGNPARLITGVMALILAGGDSFHLLPRMKLIRTGDETSLRAALGRGKQVTSITMTIFYVLMWHLSLILFPGEVTVWTVVIYALAVIRIILCFFPQNRWTDRYPPTSWGILRNLPFFLTGLTEVVRFFCYRSEAGGLSLMWAAILLSFICYLPVVLWSNRNPKVGMLMLPKTCAYLWMICMCLTL